VKFAHAQSREDYLSSIKKILEHIQKGDIYELNYCHEVKFNASGIDAIQLYNQLNALSTNPFSAYFRNKGCHLLCASPERFLMKKGNELFSQPMKGTAARNKNKATDAAQKAALEVNEKEQSENVMIVDLVRNDLSKVAAAGSVKVNELFGVYTFPGAHQMISTVSCKVKEKVTYTDIIRATFPMGSMTGAPKVSAMKRIDTYETFRRGLFSGTIGYIHPCGDFDFNVVIRSILYNEHSGNLCVPAGGAITAASNPEQEYDETMVKLAPQLKALGVELNQLKKTGPADHYA
jgi:para-aminobenzoate synthetase component 1